MDAPDESNNLSHLRFQGFSPTGARERDYASAHDVLMDSLEDRFPQRAGLRTTAYPRGLKLERIAPWIYRLVSS